MYCLLLYELIPKVLLNPNWILKVLNNFKYFKVIFDDKMDLNLI